MHIILPIDPPTVWRARMVVRFSESDPAAAACTGANVRFETVLDPEKNDPSAPSRGANKGHADPAASAIAWPMSIAGEIVPPSIIIFTSTNAPTSAIAGRVSYWIVSPHAAATAARDIRSIGTAKSATTTNGKMNGT